MATLNVGGRKVTVDDSFLQLSPDQQAATVDEIHASFPSSQPDPVMDVAKSAGSGLARGTAMVIGQGGDLNRDMERGLQKLEQSGPLMGAAGLPQVNVAQSQKGMLDAMPEWLRKYHEKAGPDLSTPTIMQAMDETAGAPVTSYKPETGVGRVTQTAASFVPAAMMGKQGLLRGAALPGAASELAGMAAEGSKYETAARIAGAVVGGSVLPNKTVATGAQLKNSATAAYKSPEVQNLRIDPRGPANLADDIIQRAEQGGAREHNATGAYRTIDELRTIPGSANVGDLKSVRTALNTVIQDGTDPLTGALNTNASVALQAKKSITEYLGKMPAKDVIVGDAPAAAATLSKANDNWAAYKRTGMVDALLKRAGHRAGSTYSGGNVNNTTRQELRKMLDNDRMNSGLNAAESKQLERAVMGTKTGNAARIIGKALAPTGALALAPSGTVAGLSFMGTGDAKTSAEIGAVAAALGMGGKFVGNRSAARQSGKFRDMVASRAPLMSDPKELARLGINPTPRNMALVQALMAGRSEPVPQR